VHPINHINDAAARAPAPQACVRLVRKHHLLVRVSHWLNIPLLLGLIVSGISIYWASPIYQHRPDPQTGNFDYVADAGIWICRHVAWQRNYPSPPDWVYDHVSLGPYMLAPALRLHWCCAYLFMLNGLAYLAGVLAGGEWRSLLPHVGDIRGAAEMARHYLAAPFGIFGGERPRHTRFETKYNPLQRLAYFSVPIGGLFSVATGWAIHKPMQFSRVAACFGGFDRARVWHFWLMCIFVLFAVPHVVLVVADGWDTLRSMITGWSMRVEK
jgi:thiosulfate reductase cytochrome b subunit